MIDASFCVKSHSTQYLADVYSPVMTLFNADPASIALQLFL